MTSTPTPPPVGSVLPLPHLGDGTVGTVTDVRWSEALGEVLYVRPDTRSCGELVILYGDHLAAALTAEAEHTAGHTNHAVVADAA